MGIGQEGSSDLGVISISEDGRIRTSERLEVACIHARDRNTARTEVAACVRVAEVSSNLTLCTMCTAC